jgi:amidase
MRCCLLFAVAVCLSAQVPEHYYRTFSHDHPVFLRIQPGERVATKTIDTGGKDFRGEKRSPEGDPLTGPFYVEGAEAGDAILVTLHKVRLNRNWGLTAARLSPFALMPDILKRLARDTVGNWDRQLLWDLDLEDNMVRLHEPPQSARVKFEFPARPMLGCIGVAAPGKNFSPQSGEAGNYGGNMDYNEVVEGSTVILPVFHPGALLYLGDGHALMADGEPTRTGIETSMDVEFSVDVKKEARLTGPRLETADYLISVGSQPFVSSLDHALKMATTDMVRWLTGDYQLEPWAAHQLIGAVGKYDVVTVGGSIALKIPKKYLLVP